MNLDQYKFLSHGRRLGIGVVIWRYGDCANSYGDGSPGGANGGNGKGYVSGTQGGGGTVVIWY